MQLLAFGDIHGHWREFRDAVRSVSDRTPLELVLQCGDAQPFRDEGSLVSGLNIQHFSCSIKRGSEIAGAFQA